MVEWLVYTLWLVYVHNKTQLANTQVFNNKKCTIFRIKSVYLLNLFYLFPVQCRKQLKINQQNQSTPTQHLYFSSHITHVTFKLIYKMLQLYVTCFRSCLYSTLASCHITPKLLGWQIKLFHWLTIQ